LFSTIYHSSRKFSSSRHFRGCPSITHQIDGWLSIRPTVRWRFVVASFAIINAYEHAKKKNERKNAATTKGKAWRKGGWRKGVGIGLRMGAKEWNKLHSWHPPRISSCCSCWQLVVMRRLVTAVALTACSSPPPPSGGAPKKHPTTHRPQLAYAYALGSQVHAENL